jgi:ABC-type Co2+ transport system permease subunit
LPFYLDNYLILSFLSQLIFIKINIIFLLFNIMTSLINIGELMKRIIKYLVEGLMVAIAAFAIPKRSLNVEEIVLLALTAAATFSILDTYVPSMGSATRSGAGFGIGANLVRFPGGF